MENKEIKVASVRLEQAMDFINEVNLRFHDRRDQYQLFLTVLTSNFQKGPNLISKTIACILKDHPDLITTFDKFLSDAESAPIFNPYNIIQI